MYPVKYKCRIKYLLAIFHIKAEGLDMNRYSIVLTVLCLFALPVLHAQEQTKTDGLSIVVTSLDITDKALNVQYEIRNDSKDDVWILVGTGGYFTSAGHMAAEVFMAEDNQTLMVRDRLNLQSFMLGPSGNGRYVRLRSGESQTESIITQVPVHPIVVYEHPNRQENGLEHATRLAIELGYYSGNLPEIILRAIEEESLTHKKWLSDPNNTTAFRAPSGKVMFLDDSKYPNKNMRWSDGVLLYSSMNENLHSRDEEFLIPYSVRILKDENEQVLRKVVNNVHIPYEEKRDNAVKPELPDFSSCIKIKVEYKPSTLEYFFPYAFQLDLLSREEIEYLQSENSLVLEKYQDIKAIAHDFSKWNGFMVGAIVRYRSNVNMLCYYDNETSSSIDIYNNGTILTERARSVFDDGFPSLKKLTPRIQTLSLRMQCAANLKNLWYRFIYYNVAEMSRKKNASIKREEKIYPAPTDWCDSMLKPFYPSDIIPSATSEWDGKTLICPSAGEGKCHYAMNPNCGPNSPGDMVLLFETKAGWNQHGGPELFTFDNHKPQRPVPNVLSRRDSGGGCVLLNNGTIKFIRTRDELLKLRWKTDE
jgi:hypothetical protein